MGNKAHWRKITGQNRLVVKKAWCYKADEFTMFNMEGLTEHGCYFNIFNNGHRHDFAVDFNTDPTFNPMQLGPTTQAEQSFVPPTFMVTENYWGSDAEMGSLFIENDDGYLIVFCTPSPVDTTSDPTPTSNYGGVGAFVSIERGADNKKQLLACSNFTAPGVQEGFYLVTDDSDTSRKVGTFRQLVQNENNPTYPANNKIFKEDPIYFDNEGNIGGTFDNFKVFALNYTALPNPNAFHHNCHMIRTTDADGNRQLWIYIGYRCWVPIDSLDFGTIDGDDFVDSQGASGETIDRVVT